MSHNGSPAPIATALARVLVVDDEHANLSTFQRALRLRCEVKTATSGESALRLLQENPVDVLVTDYAMPGMNGRELLHKARLLLPGLPCILVTAYAELDEVRDAARTSGVVKVLMKPWDKETLFYWINHCAGIASMRKVVSELNDATNTPSGSHRTQR